MTPDKYFYKNKAADIINSLLRKINDFGQHNIQYLVMFDEITADIDGGNFTGALYGIARPIAFMAVNPGAYGCLDELEIIAPEGENVNACRMKLKHRNAFPIANLLIHTNDFWASQKNYKILSTSHDQKIDLQTLAPGHIPIWIKLGEGTSIIHVLDYVARHLMNAGESTSLLFSAQKGLPTDIENFCNDHHWKITSFWDMTGGEDDNVISIIEDNRATIETFSRAKKRLIIITK